MANKNKIQNNFGDPQVKTAAPADKQPQGGNSTPRSTSVIPSNLQQVTEEYLGKPAFQRYEQVEVVIDPESVMFSQLAARIHEETVRCAKAITEPGEEYLSRADITGYLKTLVMMRVQSVNGVLSTGYRQLPALMVHPFFAVIVDQIGLVRDSEFGLDFVPQLPESLAMLGPEEMLRISEALYVLEPAGLKSISVMVWKDTSGTLEFMGLQHLDGVVRGARVSHTVYGFFASMFNTMATYENVGIIPRVVYGYDNTYKMYLNAIFNRS